jgi:hypothetical protein
MGPQNICFGRPQSYPDDRRLSSTEWVGSPAVVSRCASYAGAKRRAARFRKLSLSAEVRHSFEANNDVIQLLLKPRKTSIALDALNLAHAVKYRQAAGDGSQSGPGGVTTAGAYEPGQTQNFPRTGMHP